MPYVCFQCTFVNVMRLLPATSVALIEQWVQCVCWNNNFELMDLWSRYLTWWFSLTSSTLCSKVTGWKIFFCSYGCSQFVEKWKWSWGKPVMVQCRENVNGNDAVLISVWHGRGVCCTKCCCSSLLSVQFFITFCTSHRRRKMYSGHGRLYVCMCVSLLPHAHTAARTRV